MLFVYSTYLRLHQFIHRLALIEEGADIQMVELKNEVQSAIAEREVADELRASAEAKLTKQLEINKLLEDSNRQLGREFHNLEEKCNKYFGRLKKKKQLLADANAEIATMAKEHAREMSEVDQKIELAFEKGQEKGTALGKEQGMALGKEQGMALGREQGVEAYKDSEEHDDDMARAGLQSYRGGFRDALNAVAARYPDMDLSGLHLSVESESEVEEESSPPEAPDAPAAPVDEGVAISASPVAPAEPVVLPVPASTGEELIRSPEAADAASTTAGSPPSAVAPIVVPDPVEGGVEAAPAVEATETTSPPRDLNFP